MKRIDQICDGIYRIGEFWPEFGISVNQFLIVDDQPALIHTGTFPMFEGVRSAVGQIMDPKRLAYVVVPHFEADECGGMGRFVKDARKSTLLCSELGITQDVRADHAQYLASWLKLLKDDSRAIFTAAAKASEAVAFLKRLQPPA